MSLTNQNIFIYILLQYIKSNQKISFRTYINIDWHPIGFSFNAFKFKKCALNVWLNSHDVAIICMLILCKDWIKFLVYFVLISYSSYQSSINIFWIFWYEKINNYVCRNVHFANGNYLLSSEKKHIATFSTGWRAG